MLPIARCAALHAAAQDRSCQLPPALRMAQQECEALESWLHSLHLPDYVPMIWLVTAARGRRYCQDNSTGAPAVQQAGAGGTGQPAVQQAGTGSSGPPAAEQRWPGGTSSAELEPVEDSLSWALGGAEILELELAAEQPQRLVIECSSALCRYGLADMSSDQVLQVAARLERIGGLLDEAAAAAGGSVHVLHSLAGGSGRHIACVAPDSVWVLTIEVYD